jgi:hypothetical protein
MVTRSTTDAKRSSVIPPTLTRLKYIKQTLRSSDWSYSRIDVVIITQIEMHISVILATIPCIRPWLNAFESGGLQAPAEVRRESRRPTPVATKLAPLLPIAMTPAINDNNIELSMAGHRKRVEAWPVQFFPGDTVESKTVTTVEHDPVEAREMARKASRDSQGSRGITRTTSFSVKFQDIEGHTKQQKEQGNSKPSRLSRTFSSPSDLYDAGGLLEEVPRAKLKSRTGSMASV